MKIPFSKEYPNTTIKQYDDSELFTLAIHFNTEKDVLYLRNFR